MMNSNRISSSKPQLFFLLMLVVGQWGTLHFVMGNFYTRQYHLLNIPWSRTKCPLAITRKSAMECAAACLAAGFICLGSSFRDSSPTACALCDNKHAMQSSDIADSTIFQMPVKYMSEHNAVEMTVPEINFWQCVVYVAGVPLDQFGIAFKNTACTSNPNMCYIDFYLYVSSGNATLAKNYFGSLHEMQTFEHHGVFESERRFQMVVVMSYYDYVIIVDGVELRRYPMGHGEPDSMTVSTEELYQVSMALNDIPQ